MQTYLVGGAVRDALLGRAVAERDWVVVGATPEQMLELGYTRADATFPVFIDPTTGDEYALARRETKVSAGHKGFTVEASPEVTLEEDLARRDLTVNAIAESADGTLVDPFEGRDDLESRVLRHVTPAFVEDPLRVLRAARFATLLEPLGFTLAPETAELMGRMARGGELATLSAHRIWRETSRALAARRPGRFIEILAQTRALPVLIGTTEEHAVRDAVRALNAAASDADTDSLATVLIVSLTPDAPVQTARRLGAPAEAGETARLLHLYGPATLATPVQSATDLLAIIEGVDGLRRPERMDRFARACRALGAGDAATPRAVDRLVAAARAAAATSVDAILASGLEGPAVGTALRVERLRAIDSALTQDIIGAQH